MTDALEGWSDLGHPIPGPGAALHPMASPDGALYLALRFRQDLVDHPMLRTGMDDVAEFVRAPGVDGIAPLAAWDRSTARFVYPIGQGVTLAQLMIAMRKADVVPGPRAALELISAIAPILDAGSAAGKQAGVYNHGALSPWRIVLHPQGRVTLIGYAVPAVDVMAWLDEETDHVDPTGLATTPPERIEDADEDVRADLFALGLVAAELALGRPLLADTAEALVDGILAGAAEQAVRSALTGPLADLLARAVALTPDARPSSGSELARGAAALESSAAGKSLADMVVGTFGSAHDLIEDDTSVQFSVPEYSLPIPEGLGGRPPAAGETTQPLGDVMATLHDEPNEPAPVSPPPRRIEAQATEVVSQQDHEALLQVARATQVAPTDDGMVAAAVPDLTRDASLEQVQAHARAIVARTTELADQARTYNDELQKRTTEAKGDFGAQARAARQASDRAAKAARSATSAANLLELDEDAAGAMITLDLVRNAETQAALAAREAADQLAHLRRVVERARQQQQALRDAVQRARQHADAATEAADQADALVTALEEDARKGLLAAPEVDDAIDSAIASAEAAHAAAGEAREHADGAGEVDKTDLATRQADEALAAEQEARRHLAATRSAAEQARRVEAESRSQSVTAAVRHGTVATSAAEEAEQALQRADDALAIAAPPQSRDLRSALEAAATAARQAASEAERAATVAQESPHSGEGRRRAIEAEQAAERASDAASRAKEASDRIVQLAGAVAEARAEVTKRHDEATQLLDTTRRSAARSRSEVDALFEETRQVTSAEALEARAEALSHVQQAETRLVQLEVVVQTAAALDDVTALDERLQAVRSLAAQVTGSAEDAHRHISAARDAAERELAELTRREALRAAVVEAAREAETNALRCREQVDAAWAVARSLSDSLKTTAVEEAIRLRTKALELIDIAEFQAGEADSSAELAGKEHDPAEARAHAQTARAFLERITTDLPEALDGLRRAEELAQKEMRTLQSARDRTAEIARTVERISRDVTSGLERARTEASEWRDVTGVAAELGQLGKLSRTFQEEENESTWCADQARASDLATEAMELLPRAEATLERARDKQRRAQVIAESLAKAIASAVAEQQAVGNARKAAADSVQAAADLLAHVQQAEERLKDAVKAHGAQDVPVANAQLGMREARQRIELNHKKLVLLAEQAAEADDTATVKRLAAQARELLAAAESAREIATDAETEGIAAAEHEHRAREDAERRRLQAAAEDADAQVERARAIVRKVDVLLDEAEEEVTSSAAAEARDGFEQSSQLSERLRSQVAELERLAQQLKTETTVASADSLAERSREIVDQIAAASSAIHERVQHSLDLARAAEAEAEAIQKVRAEVRATSDKAKASVERAKSEAKRILGLMTEANRSAVRALADEASTHIQTATQAAAKIDAAAPLADQAETLAVAQSILKTSRLALERAEAAADAVQALVEEAIERARREQEDAARALDDAREHAAQPVQEATAAAKKAEGWLEAGQREVHDHSGESPTRPVASALRTLSERVGQVLKLAEDAAVLAGPARDVESVEGADAIATDVRAAADQTIDKARKARAALDVLRQLISTEQQAAEATEAAHAETSEHAASARQAAEQAAATVQELELAVEAAGVLDDAVRGALAEAQEGVAATSAAADAAHQAMERASSATSVEDAELAADAAHDALQQVIDGLTLVVEKEAVCREALAAAGRAAEETARKEREDRRRRKAEEQRAAEAKERQEEADREAERRRRDEERKARFERRQREREQRTGKSAATDRESLRSRLKERRPPDADDVTGTKDRPRRRGTARSRVETQDTAERDVRSWSPASEGERPSHPSIRARPQRASRPKASRPAREDDDDAPVDALLERLRARRSKD